MQRRVLPKNGPMLTKNNALKFSVFLMNHIASGVAEAKEAHIVDLQLEQLAEEQVCRLVHNHTGKSQKRDHRSWYEEHGSLRLGGLLPTAKLTVVLLLADNLSRVEPVARTH